MSDQTYFQDLIGKRVIVIWRDLRHDWIAFRLIWEDCGNVKMQGVALPNGSPHDGTCVICPVSDIHDMIEWKEDNAPQPDPLADHPELPL